MADIADAERRVTAPEAAQIDNTKTLNWVAGTLDRVSADVSVLPERQRSRSDRRRLHDAHLSPSAGQTCAGEFRLQADITLGLKQDPKIDYAACLPCDAPQSMALRNLHEVAANIPF